jgi:class 3 adenylate cyclase
MGEIRDFRLNRSGIPQRHWEPRRLATIVAGDISGYSRLVQIDKEGTRDRVKRIERELVGPSILEHNGRLIKTTGDGFVAVFDSPVEAARCGIHIRQSMIERNALLPKHHRIKYRIGVNVGDVVTETTDIYGDGVNIASCLAAMAGPAQIFISSGMYEQMKHKLACVGYQSLGDRKIKNITDPLRVYRLLPDPDSVQRIQGRRENILIFLLVLALLAIASGTIWCFGESHRKMGEEASGAGSQEMQNISALPVYHEASNADQSAFDCALMSPRPRA